MTILAHHGVAEAAGPRRFAFRNLCDTDTFRRFLSAQPRFVSITDAVAGLGDALTIDDATQAAADAALIAREYGHDVSVFVNPGQVQSEQPYAFVLMNVLLDELDGQDCVLDGTTFTTSTRKDREALRRHIKATLRSITDEQARLDFVKTLASRCGVDRLDVPRHFRTLAKSDLVDLRQAGVDLQNHGWTHTDHAVLSAEESSQEIHKGRTWLQQELGVDARYFAVPFGDVLPQSGATAACDGWLTAFDEFGAGRLAPNVFNRVERDPTETTASSGELQPGRRHRVRSWTLRVLKRFRF